MTDSGRIQHLVRRFAIDGTLFEDKSQLDVMTILLILGESVIWKAIWSRLRFRRKHWSHWIFAVSPGWAPLAGSIFAAIESARGPPNLVFNRTPENALDDNLIMTNLASGASHAGKHVIVQNIWQAWHRGACARKRRAWPEPLDVTREVGIVDVDLNSLHPQPPGWRVLAHAGCLLVQLGVGLALGLTGYTFETLIVLGVTFTAQIILMWAVIPRDTAWNGRKMTLHKPAPAMLHKGLDSTGVLILRSLRLNGRQISPEEYSWETQAIRTRVDYLKMIAAGFAFAGFIIQILLIGWMQPVSRISYFAVGVLGLVINAVDGSIEADWESIFDVSFSGESCCEPHKSSLMAAVGVLIAAAYPAADAVAKLLYPDNKRFSESLASLKSVFDAEMCDECRQKFQRAQAPSCSREGDAKGDDGQSCRFRLASRVQATEGKQIKDGIAAACHFLRWEARDSEMPRLETKAPYEQYSW